MLGRTNPRKLVGTLVMVTTIATLGSFSTDLKPAHAQASCKNISVQQVTGGDEQGAVSGALSNQKVIALQKYMASRGYIAKALYAGVSKVECTEQGTFTVTLIPFTESTGEVIGHIASISGNWGNKSYDDAVAFEGANYAYQAALVTAADKVVSVPTDQWEKSLPLPLGQISGYSHKLAPTLQEKVGTQLPTTQMSQNRAAVDPLAVQPLTTYCTSIDALITSYTTLGAVAYRFHQTKYWCYNGSQVSSVSVGTYVSDADGFHIYRGIVSSWDTDPLDHSYHVSFRQGQVDNCIIQYGCISTQYPHIKITSYANGTYATDGGF